MDSEDELGQLTRAFNEMQLQLRQVDVARKEFVATASHELRTPIFSLGGFLELLRDEDLDEDTRREFLDTAVEQTERLQRLAVDLLDLSRLDAGSMELTARGWTCPRSRWRWSASSGPPCSATTPSVEMRLRRGFEPPVTGKGWLRSCASCSTTRSATRPRAPT